MLVSTQLPDYDRKPEIPRTNLERVWGGQGLFLFNAQVVANQELKVFARHERGFLVL
jgi:hypothetical protein